jgi:hypothetical protein
VLLELSAKSLFRILFQIHIFEHYAQIMKVTWIIFFILGILLVLMNLPASFVGDKTPHFSESADRIAYLIGRNVGFIVGAIFLLVAFFVHKKWRIKKQKAEHEKLIDNIAND